MAIQPHVSRDNVNVKNGPLRELNTSTGRSEGSTILYSNQITTDSYVPHHNSLLPSVASCAVRAPTGLQSCANLARSPLAPTNTLVSGADLSSLQSPGVISNHMVEQNEECTKMVLHGIKGIMYIRLWDNRWEMQV